EPPCGRGRLGHQEEARGLGRSAPVADLQAPPTRAAGPLARRRREGAAGLQFQGRGRGLSPVAPVLVGRLDGSRGRARRAVGGAPGTRVRRHEEGAAGPDPGGRGQGLVPPRRDRQGAVRRMSAGTISDGTGNGI
ncbi:MAG: hypothetical protein AVDCRST_MAG05-2508, partial [uncultured Rubrobacteraceae bacterium]